MIQQQHMNNIVTIPPEALTDLLKAACQPSVVRFRLASGKKKVCIAFKEAAATHKLDKCKDDKTEQHFFLEQAADGYQFMRNNPGGEPWCLTEDLTYVPCSKTDFKLQVSRTKKESVTLKRGKKCLTVTGTSLDLKPCNAKQAKKQTWFVEPVFNQAPSLAIEESGEILASSLSKAMSQILYEEVGKMERAMYQQMEYMLKEAGLELNYDSEGSAPAPPAVPLPVEG
jgi:hypothetical protein